MRVRLLSLMAGPQGVWQPGSVLDVTPEEARVLVASGYATAVDAVKVVPAPPAQETAALTVPETPERAVPKPQRKG